MNIPRLFPTLLGISQDPNHGSYANSLVDKCLQLSETIKSGGEKWVSKDTYNTMGSHDLFQDKDFTPINDFVVKSVKEFCGEIKVDINEVVTANSWFNIYRKGDYQEYHNHNPCFLSVIYYLKTPKDGAKLFIKNPFDDMLLPQYKESTIDNNTIWEILPKEGMLLIFRSHLEHCVEKHMQNDPRISLAYNFYYFLTNPKL
jgi:uncharacterized protein (TIGR02466 family)